MPRLGPRDTLITLLRWQMRAFGMNPYRYEGLSRTGKIPLSERMAELERRKATGHRPAPKTGGCPKCGNMSVTWMEGDITPTGRYRVRCRSCDHRFTKDPKFLKVEGPSRKRRMRRRRRQT